jgi:hypothetical protein
VKVIHYFEFHAGIQRAMYNGKLSKEWLDMAPRSSRSFDSFLLYMAVLAFVQNGSCSLQLLLLLARTANFNQHFSRVHGSVQPPWHP